MHMPMAPHRFAGAIPTADRTTTRQLIAGRVLSTIAALFLFLDGTAQLGYPTDVVFGLGLTLLLCVLAYIVPATSFLGALLLTGYLGGAVATHVRVGNPLFTHVLFPTYVAVVLWGGLALRDPRLRALLTARRAS